MFLKIFLLVVLICNLLSEKCSASIKEDSETLSTLQTTSEQPKTTQPISTTPGSPSMILGGQPYIWAPGGRHYPKANNSLVVETNPGYVISVEITKCNIDGDGGDYLQINSGNLLNSTEGLVLTFELEETRKYLFHSTQVTAFFRVNDTSENHNGKTGVEVVFTRLGEITTTTAEPTTTTMEHPTTAKGEEASIQVDIYGHSDNDYRNPEMLDCLRNALLNMAKAYCEVNNIIPRDNNITLDNILLKHLIKCPYSWPNSEKCVQVVFAIPIFLSDDSPVQGYQLNRGHLTSMWQSFAKDYLSNCHMSTYKEPNVNGAIKWWVIITVSVTLAFFILLCIIKKGCIKWSHMKRKRRSSDTITIMSHGSIGTSSLEPHYMQKTPPLFEPMYSMYKPGEETYTEPIITADLRSKNQGDESYSENIIAPENFNLQSNRLTLIQDDNGVDNEDAFA